MKYSNFLVLLFLCTAPIIGQEDLEAMLDEELGNETEYALATFLSSRVITTHSVESMPSRGLDFRVSHRFGQLNGGFKEFFGLDESNSYLSFEYGCKDWLMVGIGRATYKKMFNGFVKTVIFKQSKGLIFMPFTLVHHSAMAVNSTVYENKQKNEDFHSRIDYTHQLLIGRKFTPRLSVQLMPTIVHRNLVITPDMNNDIFALGWGLRYKIFKRVAYCMEYYQVFNNTTPSNLNYYDPLTIGVNIQSGSHVFQLHITNALPMTENAYIGETTDDFFNGDIRFGFNISQVFSFGNY